MKKAIYFILFLSLPALGGTKTFLPPQFHIKFVKELQSILKKKKKSRGTLSYKYPGNIRIEQERPFKTIFVSNGERAWLYSAPLDPAKEAGEVIVLNPHKVPITRVLDELGRGLKSNEIYQVVREGATFTLNFNRKNKAKYQVEYVKIEMITPSAKDFRQAKALTVKTQNATERYELVQIDLSPPFPPGHFDFQVTEKMKVSESP